MQELLFYIALPITAFLYASVGHGGASGYLALMALFSFAPEEMKPTALLLNIFVAGISFVQFARAGYFEWKLFWVFAVTSIPLSFVGGMIEIDPDNYKKILGILLLFAVLRMLGVVGKEVNGLKPINIPFGAGIGALIGLLSGLIGIGGGIILSPVIILLRWGDMKKAAATSALFIWVNSLAGMLGQMKSGAVLASNAWVFVGIAVVAGLTGAYVGSSVLNSRALKILLSVVLTLASIKLIFI